MFLAYSAEEYDIVILELDQHMINPFVVLLDIFQSRLSQGSWGFSRKISTPYYRRNRSDLFCLQYRALLRVDSTRCIALCSSIGGIFLGTRTSEVHRTLRLLPCEDGGHLTEDMKSSSRFFPRRWRSELFSILCIRIAAEGQSSPLTQNDTWKRGGST